MTNLTRMTFAVAAFAVVMCAGAAVQKSWTGGDGCVSDPTKWSGGAVPTAGQQAVFSGTGSYTVSYPPGRELDESIQSFTECDERPNGDVGRTGDHLHVA